MRTFKLFLILLIVYLALIALAFVGISDAGQFEASIRQDIYGNSSLTNGQGISVKLINQSGLYLGLGMDQTTFADMLDTNIFSVSVGIKKELLRNLSVHCQIGYYHPTTDYTATAHDAIGDYFMRRIGFSGPANATYVGYNPYNFPTRTAHLDGGIGGEVGLKYIHRFNDRLSLGFGLSYQILYLNLGVIMVDYEGKFKDDGTYWGLNEYHDFSRFALSLDLDYRFDASHSMTSPVVDTDWNLETILRQANYVNDHIDSGFETVAKLHYKDAYIYGSIGQGCLEWGGQGVSSVTLSSVGIGFQKTFLKYLTPYAQAGYFFAKDSKVGANSTQEGIGYIVWDYDPGRAYGTGHGFYQWGDDTRHFKTHGNWGCELGISVLDYPLTKRLSVSGNAAYRFLTLNHDASLYYTDTLYPSPGQQHDTISVNFDQDWSGPIVGIALNFRF